MKAADKSSERRSYHHGDLRKALIEAGHVLLVEEGVAGLDMRKVARRAGVSHAAPYRHFADKQALLAAIAEEGFRNLAGRILAARATASDEPSAQLLQMARAYVRFAIESPAHMQAMFSGATGDRAAHPTLYAVSKESFFALTEVIQRGQEQGEFTEGDPKQLTLTMWSLIHGLAMLLIEQQIPDMLGNDPAIEAQIQYAMQTLYKGLARRPAL